MPSSITELESISETIKALLASGKAADVAKAYNISTQLVEKNKDNDQVLINHAYICTAAGQHVAAIIHATKAYEINNLNTDAYKIIANAYLECNEPFEAMPYARRYYEFDKDDTIGLILFARAREAIGDYYPAAEKLQWIMENKTLAPDQESLCHFHLGRALSHMDGQSDKAILHLENALSMSPNNPRILSTIANLHAQHNRSEDAIKVLARVMEIAPKSGPTHWNIIRNKKVTSEDSEVIESAKKIYMNDKNDAKDRITAGYALAKILYDLKEYEGAIECWNSAGALKKNDEGFDITKEKVVYGEYYSKFPNKATKHNFSKLNSTPIFICGMPRSGTTLTEQILGAHSEVTPLGELSYMNMAVERVKGTNLPLKSVEAAQFIRDTYLKRIAFHHVETPWFTDKMPLNFRYIPLILNAFPESKVVYCRRQPQAVCFSNFSNYFPAGGLAFSCTQEDIAEYYSMHHAYMSYLFQIFSDNIYENHYELLTENQVEQTNKLLKNCDLTFEEACLDFHKSERPIQTASQKQVKQGMYKGSSEKWRRYEQWLSPMLTTLGRHGL